MGLELILRAGAVGVKVGLLEAHSAEVGKIVGDVLSDLVGKLDGIGEGNLIG